MNIFAVDEDPSLAAYQLPDKHIVKMPLECCQMISIVYSDWYHRYGPVFNKDGRPYNTKKGAFRNHPCTKWVAESAIILHGCFNMHLHCVRNILSDMTKCIPVSAPCA